MELLFLGRGSAFNSYEGNTSAYFIDKNELFLIDCGESIFERIMEKQLLDNINCINIMITHTHSDHIGSIGSLIMYCYYVINKKVNIIISKDCLYKNDLIDLIRIFGCTKEMYRVIDETQFDNKYKLFNNIRFLKTEHVSQIPSYGILFDTENGLIYYSGDTKELNNISNIISSTKTIDKIYIDTTSTNITNNVHVYIGDLNNLIPDYLKNKIYCMHVNDKKCMEMAIEYGFNIVKVN